MSTYIEMYQKIEIFNSQKIEEKVLNEFQTPLLLKIKSLFKFIFSK